jgi:hypothetical protein
MIKKSPTIILKTTVVLLGLAVLALCLIFLPMLIRSEWTGDFDYGYIFVGMYIPAIPFFFALYQVLKLLKYIDQNKAFSEFSVKALKNIKYCAFIISGLYAVGMPYIFYVADRDDAPGVVAIGFIIVFASFIIAIFANVLQRLLQNGMEIKNEIDLTV